MAEHVGLPAWALISYLVAGVLFILALRGLSSPSTSQAGNRYGMIGMAIAQRLNLEGKVGATHMGDGFDAWYPGYIDYNPVFIAHLLLDNESHDSTDAQATVTASTDFAAIGAACGYVQVLRSDEPDDIGAAAAALATGKFAFATGSVINLDGGLSIGRL